MEKNGREDDDQAKATRRLGRLSLHLSQPRISGALHVMADPCARTKLVTSETARILTSYMHGKHWDIQEKVLEFFNSRPDLQTPVEIPMAEHRELCMRQLYALVREANVRPFRLMVEDPEKYFAVAQAVGSVDLSLGIKMGVQFRSGLIMPDFCSLSLVFFVAACSLNLLNFFADAHHRRGIFP